MAISTRQRQFEAANNKLTADQLRLKQIEAEMATLQKEKTKIEQQIESDRQNKTIKGMLYYSSDRRNELLAKAASLQYSASAIQRLSAIDNDQWNADYVNCELIDDFAALEEYVHDNEPASERSLFARLGRFINEGG